MDLTFEIGYVEGRDGSFSVAQVPGSASFSFTSDRKAAVDPDLSRISKGSSGQSVNLTAVDVMATPAEWQSFSNDTLRGPIIQRRQFYTM